MKRKRPVPKDFKTEKHQAIIAGLSETMKELDFEKACEAIAEDILLNYEGFDTIEPGPNLKGRPFDFFGYKKGKPYIIEMKGSLKSFNAPGYVQKRRLQEIMKQLPDLSWSQIGLWRGGLDETGPLGTGSLFIHRRC